MKAKGMTQQEFANATGISPAGLSNIFNGRTNPTYGHLSKIHENFPEVNIAWLFFGEGEMLNSDLSKSADGEGQVENGTGASASTSPTETAGVTPTVVGYPDGLEFSTVGGQVNEIQRPGRTVQGISMSEAPRETIREIVKYTDKPQRKITEIRIFFDDGTYETFGPK